MCVYVRTHRWSLTQSCLTLCNPMDCSPPDFSVHGISQARILEWVPFSSPADLPDPGIECRLSPPSPALTGRFLTSVPPGKPCRLPGSESDCVSHSVVCDSLPPPRLYPARLLCLWDSSGKNTGVGRHALLQGILPNQGLNPGLPCSRQTSWVVLNNFITLILSSQSYGFSSSHVWIWELDYKESWTPKN